MTATTALYDRTLRHLFEASGKDFEAFLPKEVTARIASTPQIPELPQLSFEQELHLVHYSWFVSFLLPQPQIVQRLYLGVLSTEQQGRITRLEKLPEALPLHPLLKHFLQKQLYNRFFPRTYLPASFLDLQLFTPLFSLSKERLVQLLLLLGIQDLTLSLKLSVNKRLLEIVYGYLTPVQRRYLDYCLHMPILQLAPTLSLEQLGRSNLFTQQKIHQWGLQRLVTALSVREPACKETLAYRFDEGRGRLMLLSKPSPVDSPKAVMQLSLSIKQILSLLIPGGAS